MKNIATLIRLGCRQALLSVVVNAPLWATLLAASNAPEPLHAAPQVAAIESRSLHNPEPT